jgi:hypothetical protein
VPPWPLARGRRLLVRCATTPTFPGAGGICGICGIVLPEKWTHEPQMPHRAPGGLPACLAPGCARASAVCSLQTSGFSLVSACSLKGRQKKNQKKRRTYLHRSQCHGRGQQVPTRHGDIYGRDSDMVIYDDGLGFFFFFWRLHFFLFFSSHPNPTATRATCDITQLGPSISHHMESTIKSPGRPAAIHMEQGGANGPPATGWVSHLAHLVPSKARGTGRWVHPL